MFDKTNEIHVWDADQTPAPNDTVTILWRQSPDSERANTIAISKLVEQDADALRKQYLAWVYSLGETEFKGKKVVEHLLLRPGLSYWWMAGLAQKFNLSEPSSIHDAFKAMALEKWVAQRDIRTLVLSSENDELDACLGSMCLKKGIRYERRRPPSVSKERSKGTLYQRLPYFCQALIYFLGYFLRVAPLLIQRKRVVQEHYGDVMFVDILVHLDQNALSQGKFVSYYWTDLTEKLNEWKIKCSWLHVFYRHPAIPDHASAQHKIDQFNQNSKSAQWHLLLESAISIKIFWRCLLDYLKLRRGVSAISGLSDVNPENSDLNIWPLHASEWRNSVLGGEAVINCMRISLFEEVLRDIPTQKLGIYLAENQPWEIALLQAWKANGHKAIVGVPHTTVRFWDLRYHHDSRCYMEKNVNTRMPQPDGLAVNGPVAQKSLISGGYPPDRLVGVEALRFRHLGTDKQKACFNAAEERPLTVLICGDFLAETNKKMLDWTSSAAKLLPADTVYLLKPHPAFSLNHANLPDMKLTVTDLPIAKLLSESDVVFASDTTSAAVDAYCSGVPVVIMWDGGNFNLSPLRELDEVNYVGNAAELAEAIKVTGRSGGMVAHEFFHTDEGLVRWKKMISAYASMH